MYGYIYITTNTVNGKYYIGKHKAEAYDPNYFGSGIALTNAMKKYGKDKFVNAMLDIAESLDELNKKEKEYIKLYDSQHKGYNIAPGGDGGEVWGEPSNHPSLGKHGLQGERNPMYGKRLPDESIERTRQSLTGRKRITKDGKWKSVHPEEVDKWLKNGWRCPSLEEKIKKEKQKNTNKSKSHKGGWHHSEESKRKISESNIKVKSTPEYREKRSLTSKKAWAEMSDEKRMAFKNKRKEIQTGKKRSEEAKRKTSESLRKGYESGLYKSRKGQPAWNKGMKLPEEQRKILAERAVGRIHITNGEVNRMIYPEEFEEFEKQGFWKGRTIHKKEENKNA